jgi:hypothetical protein
MLQLLLYTFPKLWWQAAGAINDNGDNPFHVCRSATQTPQAVGHSRTELCKSTVDPLRKRNHGRFLETV